ncbi:hypothetical protein GQ600_19375 [Phytophthora cactorum]|nr:hypothetical protein GQ600_19375 [Phytophthora cactorum]
MEHAKYNVTEGADFSCGWTNPKGTPQPIPAGVSCAPRDTPTTDHARSGSLIRGCIKATTATNHCHAKNTPSTIRPAREPALSTGTGSVLRFLKNSYSWQVYKECIPLISNSTTK